MIQVQILTQRYRLCAMAGRGRLLALLPILAVIVRAQADTYQKAHSNQGHGINKESSNVFWPDKVNFEKTVIACLSPTTSACPG